MFIPTSYCGQEEQHSNHSHPCHIFHFAALRMLNAYHFSTLLGRLTWLAGDGLQWKGHLGVRGHRQGLCVWMKGWDHDVRHVYLLKQSGHIDLTREPAPVTDVL